MQAGRGGAGSWRCQPLSLSLTASCITLILSDPKENTVAGAPFRDEKAGNGLNPLHQFYGRLRAALASFKNPSSPR